MRKMTWKSLVSLALAGAGFTFATELSAGDITPEGVVVPVGVAQVGGEPIPGVSRSFTMQRPIHLKADSGAYDPSIAGGRRYSTPIEAWLLDRNAVTYPPDYGWSRPVKRPVNNRVPMQYYRMDPDYWYGDPRAFVGAAQFPMVYQPTDTTQLGYYYSRVPTWQPNPAMIPGPPWPSLWHRRECPEYSRSRLMGAPYNDAIYGGIPTPAGGPVVEAPGEMQPVPQKAAPEPIPAKPATTGSNPNNSSAGRFGLTRRLN